ncbi:MAG: glycoside hydrolase family 88 protein [Proteiniphilum sp.]|jgi:unsaturated rhamnogalacturonyl hydrolase|nr:glycoside hydrolase family 88 protein [Proteiniphilum sp.]NCD14083.1 glycoside hydrolase family 88 protein [Bacteroidia bacterium]HHT35132.1 glycoside hydrolase family 88 protein [Bacteroidales bacterium]MDD2726733.1 glycoside hydrolase family 88 protein [Proteiniphilum sp.]MDD3555500.1 glycoside hydrolase family 88 protein [Proteiniphilum sp.]
MNKIQTSLLFIPLVSLLLNCSSVKEAAADPWYIRMADSEMQRYPESWMVDFSEKIKWNYTHGLEMLAMIQASEKSGDEKYYRYAEAYADTMVNDDGTIKTYQLERYNIDHINPGKILFPIYDKSENPKYLKALQLLRSQMETHPRISNGGFWHKQIYPHQVWLDGLYMAGPFLAEYGKRFNEPALFDEAALQLITAWDDLIDEESGLLYHGWDESRQQRWADPVTGRSPHFWSRSIGWYMMAMVDVLDHLPEEHPQRAAIIERLNRIATAVERYRDPATGMWYQVTNLGEREGNYLESSGSIMFIYSWVKGAQKGYLPDAFLQKGAEAYDQFLEQFIRENEDGTISVTDVCSVAGLGGEKRYRDGSFEYYISEPIRDDDPKAVGPFIMTSILLER